MYASHPNRYQLEQIRKMKESGDSIEEISRALCIEEDGIKAHFDTVDELTPEDPEQGTEQDTEEE